MIKAILRKAIEFSKSSNAINKQTTHENTASLPTFACNHKESRATDIKI